MTSFLEKLNEKLNGNGKGRHHVTPGAAFQKVLASAPKPPSLSDVETIEAARLNVDVYQSPKEVIIFALAAGVDPNDFEVLLDEENDMVTIRGTRKRPDDPNAVKPSEQKEPEGKYIQQECAWDTFYRKIILPAEVDVVQAEAVFKKGVLRIHLPILATTGGRKLKVTEITATPSPKKEA